MNLIYTVAIGDDAWSQVGIMVDSVRRFGNYHDDLMVYSDRKIQLAGADVIVDHNLVALRNPMLAKPYIGQSVSHEYNRVLCLDADTICIGDLSPLFNLKGFSAPIECTVLNEVDRPAFSLQSRLMRIGEVGINSGTVVGDGREWSNFCSEWMLTAMIGKAWELPCCDQPALNDLIRRNVFPFTPLPKSTVHFFIPNGDPIDRNTVIIHARTPLKVEIMRCVWGLRRHFHPEPDLNGLNGDGI
jgi:hypothetical protein